jgi:hypothetical protein
MLFLAAFALVVAIASAALVSPERAPARERGGRAEARAGAYVLGLIREHKIETWRWQRLLRRPLSPTSKELTPRAGGPEYRRWVLTLWSRRVRKLRRVAANPPRKRAWLCIHRHEGPWNDAGGPYYGGLQMDLGFQRRYGFDLLRRKGTADKWTPLEQIWVAERAYRSGRGFHPWPSTARRCGLL